MAAWDNPTELNSYSLIFKIIFYYSLYSPNQARTEPEILSDENYVQIYYFFKFKNLSSNKFLLLDFNKY